MTRRAGQIGQMGVVYPAATMVVVADLRNMMHGKRVQRFYQVGNRNFNFNYNFNFNFDFNFNFNINFTRQIKSTMSPAHYLNLKPGDTIT